MNKKWIEVTTVADEFPVYLHEKTGQRKIVKPVERTILDDVYDRYWSHSSSNPPTDDLLATVRSFAIKQTIGQTKDMSRSEDIAQEVAMIIFEGLETFRRADDTAFTRWVRRTIKRVRLEEYRTSSLHTDEYNEAALLPPVEESYPDLSRLPKDFKRIAALIISGYSLNEIATSFKMTTPALRKKMQRYREKYVTKGSLKRISS